MREENRLNNKFAQNRNEMKTIERLLPVAIIALLLASCNSVDVMKRRYTSGFYVDQSKAKHTDAAPKKKDDVKTADAVAVNDKNSAVEQAGQPAIENDKSTTVAVETRINASAENKVEVKKADTNKKPAAAEVEEEAVVVKEKKSHDELSREEKAQLDYSADGADSSGRTILLVILSIFIPPLAVYLKKGGVDKWFWITLILCLLTLVGVYTPFLFSFWFVAFIIALLVVLDVIK